MVDTRARRDVTDGGCRRSAFGEQVGGGLQNRRYDLSPAQGYTGPRSAGSCTSCSHVTTVPAGSLRSADLPGGRTRPLATTPFGYGRFIGRVGGLAVALGIGVAIANGAAIASADDGQSGSSKSSSADSKSSESKSSESKSSTTSAASTSSLRLPAPRAVMTARRAPSPPPRRQQMMTRNQLTPRHRVRKKTPTSRPHPGANLGSSRTHPPTQHHPDPRGQDDRRAAVVGGDVLVHANDNDGGGPDVGGQPTRNSRTTRRGATSRRNRQHTSGSVDEARSPVRLDVHRTTAVRSG